MKFYIHCEAPEFTMVVKWEESRLGSVEEVAKLFLDNLKRKFPDKFGDAKEIKTEIKNRGKVLHTEDKVDKKIKHMDDIYVTISTEQETTDTKPEKNVTSCSTESQKTTEIGIEVPSVSLKKDASTRDKKTEKLDKMMRSADDYVKQKCLLKAITTYQKAFKEDNSNAQACHNLVEIYLKASRPGKALEWVKKLQGITKEKVWTVREAECYLNMKESDKALETLLGYCKDMRKSGGVATSHKQDVQVLLARAYLQKEHTDMALTVLQGVLRENSQHVGAMLEYSPLLFPLAQSASQKEDAMTVLLTLLANNKDDSKVKEKFASVCQEEHGMEVLKSVSGPAWNDEAALIFMATSLRDCGAIKESLELLDHAHCLHPDNPQTLLTYVHTMELVEQHTKGIEKTKQYLHNFPERKVGTFTCEMLIPILHNLKGDIYLYQGSADVVDSLPQLTPVTGEYSEEEKYLLALLFTLVKICYIKGALQLIPPVIKLLNPCCEGRDLHQTNIRNEYAYYLCISQVLKERPEIPCLMKDQSCIYFIGDSHCVTSAWQSITFQGEPHIIHPVLSTGTKIWHLREESKFFPKVNFYSAISVVPDGASVVVCFGEIDCREALVHCVEQARYDTIEEANASVIDIYIDVLMKLWRTRKWKIYVHPVMPVLEQTRSVVMEFNQMLADRVTQCKNLYWLDFVHQLVVTEGKSMKLNDNYVFDGTHCHPRYVSLLQAALEAHTSKTT